MAFHIIRKLHNISGSSTAINRSSRLSAWEAKLRDVLQLRKKLKNQDWAQIWLYALSRSYKKKEFDVYLNGTLIPWDKAWKEIRRSNAHKLRPGS